MRPDASLLIKRLRFRNMDAVEFERAQRTRARRAERRLRERDAAAFGREEAAMRLRMYELTRGVRPGPSVDFER